MKNHYNKAAGCCSLEILARTPEQLQGLKDKLKISGFTFMNEQDCSVIIVFYQGPEGLNKLIEICKNRYEVRMK